MNAPFVSPDQKSSKDFASMSGHAAKWRGECIQHFAELEQIIENVLRVLGKSPKHGSKVTLGQPVGAAFKQLRELTGSKGPFAQKGKAIAGTLSDIALWFEWRAHLTHGVVRIWRDCGDSWLLAFSHRPTGDEAVRTYAITWKDACDLRELWEARIATLREDARSLANSAKT